MILFATMHDDDLPEDEEALNDLDELDEASLDDSVLDELADETEVEDDTLGFGRLEEEDVAEDAEDVDYDTFDDVDEM
jgi:hypothetical protein